MGNLSLVSLTLVAGLLGSSQHSSALTDRVDLVEVNHFCDEYGKVIFNQLIFYDWCPETRRYQVRAWKPLRKSYQYPTRNWQKDCYTAVWYDKGIKRVVEAEVLRESWTQYDPELVERQYMSPDERAGLLRLIVGEAVPLAHSPSLKSAVPRPTICRHP